MVIKTTADCLFVSFFHFGFFVLFRLGTIQPQSHCKNKKDEVTDTKSSCGNTTVNGWCLACCRHIFVIMKSLCPVSKMNKRQLLSNFSVSSGNALIINTYFFLQQWIKILYRRNHCMMKYIALISLLSCVPDYTI